MKTVYGALALLIAAPVTAQTAPAADAQAGHSQHHQQGQAGHQHGHSGQQQGQHKECCKQVNGRMECQMMKGHGSQHGGHSQHQGHSGH